VGRVLPPPQGDVGGAQPQAVLPEPARAGLEARTVTAARAQRGLRPGGLLTIGNFGPKNPSRDYMEFGHWFLRHRSENQLYDLAGDDVRTTAGDNVCVDREPEDINLFLHLGRLV
jgi:hypothetical protein